MKQFYADPLACLASFTVFYHVLPTACPAPFAEYWVLLVNVGDQILHFCDADNLRCEMVMVKVITNPIPSDFQIPAAGCFPIPSELQVNTRLLQDA